MNIAIIGYGKMGKAIEQIALKRGHQIKLIINSENQEEFTSENLGKCDVAIEFTSPEQGLANVIRCLDSQIPVISGTTAWPIDQGKEYCDKVNGSLIHATNFSLGVNLFFELNNYLAKLMKNDDTYEVSMKEIHHTAKKDAPSGTATTLAASILAHHKIKNKWVSGPSTSKDELSILSERIDPAPGTHIITYTSAIDEIEISHTAKTRDGFAFGAVMAAEWIIGKKGIFTMKNVLFDE